GETKKDIRGRSGSAYLRRSNLFAADQAIAKTRPAKSARPTARRHGRISGRTIDLGPRDWPARRAAQLPPKKRTTAGSCRAANSQSIRRDFDDGPGISKIRFPERRKPRARA